MERLPYPAHLPGRDRLRSGWEARHAQIHSLAPLVSRRVLKRFSHVGKNVDLDPFRHFQPPDDFLTLLPTLASVCVAPRWHLPVRFCLQNQQVNVLLALQIKVQVAAASTFSFVSARIGDSR